MSGILSAKRGEREWRVYEFVDDDGQTLFAVEELYWVAGESTEEEDAYGAHPIAELYNEDDANKVSATLDLLEAAKEALESGAVSSRLDRLEYDRLEAAIEKAEGRS